MSPCGCAIVFAPAREASAASSGASGGTATTGPGTHIAPIIGALTAGTLAINDGNLLVPGATATAKTGPLTPKSRAMVVA